MSNSYKSSGASGKQIKIKPIEMIITSPKKTDNTKSIENKHAEFQQKLADARAELKQIEEQQVQMLQETQVTIEKEKKEWNETRESYQKQAQETGFNEGFNAGKADSIAQYKQLIDKANQIVHSATADYHTTIEQSEDVIVDLAIHVAEKIIKQKISEDKSSFVSLVKAAINEIKDQSMVTVYVHPDKYQLVLQQKEELIHLLPAETKLTIYMKEDMNEEDCVIEHPFGKIDAGVHTQLEQLRIILHEITLENEQ